MNEFMHAKSYSQFHWAGQTDEGKGLVHRSRGDPSREAMRKQGKKDRE